MFLTLAVQLHVIAQPPKKVVIDDNVELHYTECGEGEPIIFIHRLLDDASDRYPAIDRDEVRKLQVPMLLFSCGKSVAKARLTDAELERLMPKHSQRRVIVEDAMHILCIEQTARFRNEVLSQIRAHRQSKPVRVPE